MNQNQRSIQNISKNFAIMVIIILVLLASCSTVDAILSLVDDETMPVNPGLVQEVQGTYTVTYPDGSLAIFERGAYQVYVQYLDALRLWGLYGN